MQKWDDWTEHIKNIPSWIKNTIGLITLIVSFVLLIRNNISLSILVSITVILATLFFLSLYVIFSKRKSDLIGGGYNYKFPAARKYALALIVLIITTTITLFFTRTTRDVLFALFANKNNTPDCGAVLKLPVTSTETNLGDKEQILALIKTEPDSVLYRDTDRVMSIFTDDSILVDATNGQEWKGCEAILERYQVVASTVSFKLLLHDVVDLRINGNLATAETSAESVYDSMPSPYHQALYNQYHNSTARWTFIKYQNTWKVKTFVYGLPEK